MATISSLTQNEAFKRVIKYLVIFVGSAIYAVGFQFFMYPNNIVSGGVTGISMIINHFTGFPVRMMTIIMNVPLFLIAWSTSACRFSSAPSRGRCSPRRLSISSP